MQGSQVKVPMRFDNLKGAGVTAYEFDIEYDPTVLSAGQGAASLDGTLSSPPPDVGASNMAGAGRDAGDAAIIVMLCSSPCETER